MPNSIGPTGLTTATQAELLENLTAALQTIYGADINLASNTPDGQWINIQIQSQLDNLDLQTQIYNTLDPDNAVGVILDQRCAINGVIRKAGSYTITNITLINNQSVNLYGLDQTVQPVYTISDNAGNEWKLITTQLAVSPGTQVLAFQSATIGAILTTPNTITVPVTIVLGVTSINNPTTYTTLGTNTESDANLKLRRAQSVSNVSQGYLPGLLGSLLNLSGVTHAFVYENNTSSTDARNVPAHSIWVIVGGTATAQSIATVIYQKRNGGCGMFGANSYVITQVNGTLITILWDSVTPQNLFISLTASSINGVNAPNISAILAGLPTSFVPGVYQEVNINALASAVQVIDPNTLVTLSGFSVGQTQIATLSGVAASGTFKVNYNGATSAFINWNDSISTLQTKVQAVTGLATALVTGSIASQTLTFNLSAITDVQGLLYVTSNTLATAGSAAITFSFNEGYTNTLIPLSQKYQFAIAASQIIILPIILSPTTSTIAHTATETFTALGGYAPFTYSISVNNSGGSIVATTGVYTAGSTPNVTDTIRVSDAFGNLATATVSVT